MRASDRISVRLRGDRLQRLHRLCQERGCDVSQVVRQAVDALLANEPSSSQAGAAPARRLTPPEQVFDLVPQYLAWARGDLREERNRLFRQLLAASFVTKKHYPRTTGVVEGYQALPQLCEFFGLE